MLPIAVLATLWFAGGASAQRSAAGAGPVTAEVVSGLTVSTQSHLSFGTRPQNVTATLTNLSAGIGKFRLFGQQNRTVNVVLTAPAALVNGANLIPYAAAAGFNELADNPAALTGTFGFAGTTGSGTVRLRDSSPGKSLGQAFVYIYGTLTIGAVPAGYYSGTFTITAAY